MRERVYMCTMECVWVLENNLQDSVLSLPHVGPGVEFKLSGLVGSRLLYLLAIEVAAIVLYFLFSIFMYMCVYVPCVCRYLRSPEEGARSSETGFTGGCEPLSVSVVN